MSDEDHVELANVLRNVDGKVALSGYECNLMDELYYDWYVTRAPVKTINSSKQPRQETLWTNYDPRKV
jgi:DNA adenine methylase